MDLFHAKTKKVRKFLIEHIMRTGRGTDFRDIMESTGVNRKELGEIINTLERSGYVGMELWGENIRMISPFATISTPFKVEVKGERKWFAV